MFHCCAAPMSFQTAAGNGAKLIVLPEMWNCPYSNDSFPTYAEDIDAGPSPSTDMLSAAAQEFGVTLVGGSVPEKSNGKLYNTCCVFDHQGKLLAKHRQVPGGCQQWTTCTASKCDDLTHTPWLCLKQLTTSRLLESCILPQCIVAFAWEQFLACELLPADYNTVLADSCLVLSVQARHSAGCTLQ